MFSNQAEFVFWNNHDVEEVCKTSSEMSCTQLNEDIFKKHAELESKALDRIVSFVNQEIQKKHDKEQKLKQLT